MNLCVNGIETKNRYHITTTTQGRWYRSNLTNLNYTTCLVRNVRILNIDLCMFLCITKVCTMTHSNTTFCGMERPVRASA